MEITYHKTSVGDIDKIEPLWQKLNRLHADKSEHFARYYEALSFDGRRKVFFKKAQEGEILVLLAELDGELVGYCASSVTDGVGEVESLFVESAFRGCSIGERFMDESLLWMDSFGVKTKKIAVYAGNEAVLGFYEKFGFYKKYLILEQRDKM